MLDAGDDRQRRPRFREVPGPGFVEGRIVLPVGQINLGVDDVVDGGAGARGDGTSRCVMMNSVSSLIGWPAHCWPSASNAAAATPLRCGSSPFALAVTPGTKMKSPTVSAAKSPRSAGRRDAGS